MRRSSFNAGAISDQSAPICSQISASVLATVTDATRQQLIDILASSALSRRIGRIGQPKPPRIFRKRRGKRRSLVGHADDEAFRLRRPLDGAAEDEGLDLIVERPTGLLAGAGEARRNLAQDDDNGAGPDCDRTSAMSASTPARSLRPASSVGTSGAT